MKKLLGILCAILLIAGTAGIAGAAPCTWTDTVDEDVYVALFGSYSYTHDITDDGFVPLVDLATDYVLTIGLYDDNRGMDEWFFAEFAFVDQPGLLGDESYSFAYENQDFGASILGLVQINLFGTLDVTIQSLGGFLFRSIRFDGLRRKQQRSRSRTGLHGAAWYRSSRPGRLWQKEV